MKRTSLSKPILLFISLICTSFYIHAQTPQWQWAQGIGGSGPDGANLIVADSIGNLYEIGGAGTANVPFGSFTSPNNADGATYVAKYSPNGNILWIDFYNSSTTLNYAIPGQPYFYNMVLDHVGNLCTFGIFYTDIFVMGTDTLYAQVSTDGGSFMAKYNSATGALMSVKQINKGSNPQAFITFTKILADANEHFTALGSYFAYPVHNDTMAQVYFPYACHFIADMDSNGVYTKLKILTVDTISGNNIDVDDIALSSTGKFYLSGRYDSIGVTIARFPLPALSSDTSGYVFLTKLDSNFNFIWSVKNTYHFGNYYQASHQGSAFGSSTFLAPGLNDNVYMTGQFTGDTLLFDIFSIAAYTPFTYYNGTTFLARFDGSGQAQWLFSIQAPNSLVVPLALTSDPFGDTYMLVGAAGALNVDKLTEQGNLAWTNSNMTGQFQPNVPLMATDGIGDVYMAGAFAGTNATFGNDTLILHPAVPYGAGYGDMFTAKLGNCHPSIPSVTALSALSWCGSDSVRLTAPSGYIYLWSNGDTSRSIVVNTTGNYNVYAADSLGCYARSAAASVHANAVPALNASVIQNVKCYGDSSGQINVSATGGTAPYLYVSTPPVSNYFAVPANTYYITATDSNGCHAMDSVTITQPIILSVQLDTAHDGAVAIPSGGLGPYAYLWSNTVTIDSVEHLSTGWYIVTVTDSHGCSVIDSAFVNGPNGIAGIFPYTISLYPNPASDVLFIDINTAATIEMYDQLSEKVLQTELSNGKNIIDVRAFATGVYLITINSHGNQYNAKLLISR